ncbi:MAG: hypothetical protein KF805_04860 [Phycisphaeraceae bacterium]|nr:hypothetical protein [Phycisphaeraceae bacterium]
MTTFSVLRPAFASALMLSISAAYAQHDHHSPKPANDSSQQAAPDSSKPTDRTGDPYPLGTCPISGKKLGAMGDADIKIYDGREVRFCCPMCPPKFEKDLPASFAKIDAKIEKDQGPLYPLTTSVVTGKNLPVSPYEFVYGNRLIRLGSETEKATFLQEPKKYIQELDAAAIKAQLPTYPLTKCPVSDEDTGGAMGEAKNIVVGGRLVQLCCSDCKADVERDPAKYINTVDQARKSKTAAPGADTDKKADNGEQKQGGH